MSPAAEVLVAQRREVVVVDGPDARSFLQSLVSQDVAALAPGHGARTLLLEPQGKLRAIARVLCVDDTAFWCDTDAGVAAEFAQGLERFRIRVKVTIAVEPDLAIVEVRGADSDAVVRAAGFVVPDTAPHRHVLDAAVRSVWAPWPGLDGIDLIVPSADVATVRASLLGAGGADADAARTDTLRVVHGVVREGVDVDASTIAQEAHLEADAVSFTKGCFVGQELVCRIDSRGHVNRFVRRLVASDPTVRLRDGDDVLLADKVVGVVTTAAPGAACALATVRREVEPGATVVVGTQHCSVEAIA